MRTLSIIVLIVCAVVAVTFGKSIRLDGAVLRAGAGKVDATLPVGAPLAGYNYPPRRAKDWPLPSFGEYTTWMNPSEGVLDPNFVKALVIDTAVDFIGADEDLQKMAFDTALGMGFTIPAANVLMSAAHTHSAGGAISGDFLWAIAPAIDLLVPDLQRRVATSMAHAMVTAQRALQPAKIDIGTAPLHGVTHNRRAGFSPFVNYSTVDTQLGVLRVDALDGSPIATLWNFAIHGICYDAPNMLYSSDVMGAVNKYVENTLGGISLFINSDAGDVNPIFSQVCQNLPDFSGGPVIGAVVLQTRAALSPSTNVAMKVASQEIDFGPTSLNLTLQRLDNCTHGGPMDICSLCTIMHCDENIHLPSSWIQQTPVFTAVRFDINTKRTVFVSIPGEALTELGREIRADTLALGFDQVLLAGYTNGHLGYFGIAADEYEIGGYESLLTFWGENTSAMVHDGCLTVAKLVAQ